MVWLRGMGPAPLPASHRLVALHHSPQGLLIGENVPVPGGVLTASLERPDGTTLEEQYDLSALQPGDEVVGAEPEVLPFSPLISARMDENGVLHLHLLLWYEGEFDPEKAIAEAWPEGAPEVNNG